MGTTLLPRGAGTLLGKGLVIAWAIKRLVYPGHVLADSQPLFFMPVVYYFGIFLGRA
jgi:hypothetical protein